MGYKRILTLILAVLLLSVVTAVQAQEMPAFETTEVAEGLYSFGNGFVYNAFLVTDEGVIVMDPVDPNHAQRTLEAIREITDLPIQYLIYSHNHYDHISGGQVFKDAGATVLSHENTAAWLAEHPNPNVVMPDETWSGDSFTLTSGGRDIVLHFFGPNHGEGMTVFEFPDTRAIFTVDLVIPQRVGFAYMPDFFPMEWERTLTEMLELDFDTVMYAHNVPFGERETVTLQLQFLQDLRAAVITELQSGTNFTDIPNVVELPQYADWSGYEEWLPMNVWRIMLEMFMGV